MTHRYCSHQFLYIIHNFVNNSRNILIVSVTITTFIILALYSYHCLKHIPQDFSVEFFHDIIAIIAKKATEVTRQHGSVIGKLQISCVGF